MFIRITGIAILAVFYSVYIGKMLLQRRNGIQTDQIAKGKQRDKVFYIEAVMKIATYSVVLAEVISIFTVKTLSVGLAAAGAVIGIAGDIIFALAVYTMKDSWRAGLAREDKTKMVTGGIYKISRNPAFLGFDLVYTGILLMFFNWALLFFSAFAMIMLHLQILQEEKYLQEVFGEEYISYRERTYRYIGRRR